MKKLQLRSTRIFFFVLLFLVVLGLLFKHQILASLPLERMGYAALVDGEPISIADVENVEDSVSKQDALEQLIVQKLLLQQASKKGITVSDEELGRVLEELDVSVEEAFSRLGSTDSRERLRTQLVIAKYLNQTILRDIIVTPEETKEYYDAHSNEFVLPASVHVAHILVKSTNKELDEILQTVIDSIKKGVSFEKLAQQYSEDTVSAPLGGDLGYVYPGQTVSEFEKVAFAVPINETSKTFKTKYGFHVIKVYDKQPPKQLQYEEIKDKLQQMLLSQKQKKAFEEHTNYLRENENVIIYLNDK